MPSAPQPSRQARRHERETAKERVVRAFCEGRNWQEVAESNKVNYWTARRAVMRSKAVTEPGAVGGVRGSSVKMTVEAMSKIEEYLDEDCRHTCQQMVDRLRSGLGVVVSKSSVHRALQSMIYRVKKLRIKKITMNNCVNKAKRKTFVESLNKHVKKGDKIVYQDKTNFNMYLSRGEGWSRVGERASVALVKLRFALLMGQLATWLGMV